MQSIYRDIIYLAGCGVNRVQPSEHFLSELRRKEENNETFDTRSGQEASYMEMLFHMSKAHFLDALVGRTLQQAGVALPGKWKERISKSVRKALLFDAERGKLFDFMDQKGIWYMPLKGVILKDYYPAAGMRQMSDNDILFDVSFCNEIEAYMKSRGYEAFSVGRGNHDVYKKEPVYNFEMHRALYGAAHDKRWEAYYRNVKDRLIQNDGSGFGYHFSDEDFYVYILCHAYKHYVGSGTGLRTLLDFYVYLRAKEQELDFDYIARECETLGIREFEEQSRSLCKKIFSPQPFTDCAGEDAVNSPAVSGLSGEVPENQAAVSGLSEAEREMLSYYLSSGAYGTRTNFISNMVKKRGKVGFFVARLFLPLRVMRNAYPILKKAPFLLPVFWLVRLIKVVFVKERRKSAAGQLKTYVKVVRSKD